MKLSIVVPCYNEEEVLLETIPKLTHLLTDLIDKQKISADSNVYFVDDGSTDSTWNLIVDAARKETSVRGVKLSRNQGHQAALSAGLFTADGDVVVSMDADLQDEVAVTEEMVDAASQGFEIVYGVRKRRQTDSFLKRFTAEGYYHLLGWLGVDVVFNHADSRLLSRRSVEALKRYREVNLFLRGIIPLLGFRTAHVYYDRHERAAGVSKYPMSKMVAFALDGVTSFSAFPLRLITILGLIVFAGSMGLGLWVLFTRLYGSYVPGWASTVIPIYSLGGIQLLSIGVIGEYLAKIHTEVKARPRYHIEKTV